MTTEYEKLIQGVRITIRQAKKEGVSIDSPSDFYAYLHNQDKR